MRILVIEDEQELADAIDRVMANPTLQQEMVEKGTEYAARFGQEILTRQMMEHYLSL